MPEEKRDVLEFPIEELSIPQAVALMMQAATQCRTVTRVDIREDDIAYPVIHTDNDRLQLLCEKLEARVQDDLDKLSAAHTIFSSEETLENNPLDVDISAQIFASGTDADDSELLNWQGRLFKKLCNERVAISEVDDQPTFCIKQWGHMSREHEDKEGHVR